MILDDYSSYKFRHLYDSSREKVKYVTDVCDYDVQTGEVGVEIKIQISEVLNLKSIIWNEDWSEIAVCVPKLWFNFVVS